MDALATSPPLPTAIDPARAPGARRDATISPWSCRAAARSAPIRPASTRPCTRRDCSPIPSPASRSAASTPRSSPAIRPTAASQRLREFWEGITARPVALFTLDSDIARKATNAWSALLTTTLGQPGFFTPNMLSPWLSPRGAKTATAFYDTVPAAGDVAAAGGFRPAEQRRGALRRRRGQRAERQFRLLRQHRGPGSSPST